MKKIYGLLGLVLSVNYSLAQDTLALRLQDALDATAKNNVELLLATLNQQSAMARFNQTDAIFLPQINLSYTALVTNNPLNAFGFKLQQQSISSSDFNPQLLNSPSTTQNYQTKAEWNQPVINPEMFLQRKAAKQLVDVSYYKGRRTKEFLAFDVHKGYAQLQLSYQGVTVLTEALHTVEAIFKSAKNYFDKGFLQKSDLLLVQVQVASIESKLAEAKSNVQNASDYLSLLMGVKVRPIYTVDPLTKTDQSENSEMRVPGDRSDFKAMTAALEAQSSMISSGKMSYLPKLNAFANYMINDKTAFGFGSSSYLAGAQFSWSLFNGMATRNRIAEQKIQYSVTAQELQYQKDKSQLELSKTIRQLADARFALQQHETSVTQAAEALRILQDRFDQGLVSTPDLLQARSTLSEQRLLLAESVFKYNTTFAYIHFLTSASEAN